MNASADEDLVRVATRLRGWRDEAGLTLQQLAERCGVATSTIQKVETQQMVPTIAVLLKIANGLDKRASEFVRTENAAYQVHHSTSDSRRVTGDAKISVERLVGDLRAPELEVWRIRCGPGARHFREGIHGHGEVLVVCETGHFTARIDGKDYLMSPGASLHFKAELSHGWANHADVPAEFIIIGSIPSAIRAVMEQS